MHLKKKENILFKESKAVFMMINDVFIQYCRKICLFLKYFWHFHTAYCAFAKHMKRFSKITFKIRNVFILKHFETTFFNCSFSITVFSDLLIFHMKLIPML